MITTIRIHKGFEIKEIVGLAAKSGVDIGNSIGDNIGEKPVMNATQEKIIEDRLKEKHLFVYNIG